MKKSLYFLIGINTLLLSDCTLYEKPNIPKIQTPHQFKFSGLSQTDIVAIEWWKNFNDPTLNTLIQLALKNNDNYLIATKNIAIAKTYVTQSYSALFPAFALNYGASAQKTPSPFFSTASSSQVNLQQLNGSVSYQLNLWNQFDNAMKQSKSTLAATKAESKITKITLINSVVTTYFQIVTTQNTLLNLQYQKQAATKIVNLYTIQLKSGLIDASSLDDVKTQVENIQLNIAISQRQLAIFKNTLAYLISDYPENFNLIPHGYITQIPYKNFIPKNLSSKLVANRPDVQMAYAQAVAAGYGQKESISGFLPTFNLTGNYGYASTGLTSLLSPESTAWSMGLAIAQPIINLGQSLGAYRRSKFQYQSALISYKDSVINAFTQIDNALITYQKDHESLRFYGRMLANDQDKTRIAKAQYRSGYADYSSFLTSQLTTLQSQNNLISQQLVVITDVAAVYQNLGV